MKNSSKKTSTSFKVIVILFTLIVACFLFKFFTRQKQKAVSTYIAAVVHPHKKHKRKYKVKTLMASNSVSQKQDTTKILTAKPIAVKPILPSAEIKILPAKTIVAESIAAKLVPVKIKADTIKAIKPRQEFLYTTYVQPNVTGVVKMRAENKFYSNTIATIPSNAKVAVLAKGDTYYRISYNNSIGFVPKWALQIK